MRRYSVRNAKIQELRVKIADCQRRLSSAALNATDRRQCERELQAHERGLLALVDRPWFERVLMWVEHMASSAWSAVLAALIFLWVVKQVFLPHVKIGDLSHNVLIIEMAIISFLVAGLVIHEILEIRKRVATRREEHEKPLVDIVRFAGKAVSVICALFFSIALYLVALPYFPKK